MTTAEKHAAEVTHQAPSDIGPEQIDGAFVPRRDDSVRMHPLGPETVLIGGRRDLVHHLDPIASLVWGLFDGTSTVEELADYLAGEFQHDRDAIFVDVLDLARKLGGLGLLEGVALPVPVSTQSGAIEVGAALPVFSYQDTSGVVVTPQDLLGRRAYVVNWSSGCGYCIRLAAVLSEFQPALADKDVDLIFLVPGNPEGNIELLSSHGLTGRLLVKAGDAATDPFPGMGTPVAYLVDELGAVAEPMAYGADQVEAQLRQLIGVSATVADDHDHDHDHDEIVADSGPKFLRVASPSVCGPSTAPAGAPDKWLPARAYRVGDIYVGVRTNTAAADAVLARVLGSVRDDTLTPQDNYSVTLVGGDKDERDGGSRRGLNMLIRGSNVLVRSRSQARVVHGLLQFLSSHIIEVPAGLLFTATVPALIGDRAVLLPQSVQSRLKELQPRLTRAGIRLSDTPGGLVDLATRELVIAEPSVEFDADALAAVPDPPARGSELARVAPGRYPLAAWYFSSSDLGPLSTARAVAQAVSLTYLESGEEDLVATLADLLSDVAGVGVGLSVDEAMVTAVAAHAAG